jgi:hypothetical protein
MHGLLDYPLYPIRLEAAHAPRRPGGRRGREQPAPFPHRAPLASVLETHGEVTIVIGGVRVPPGDWIVGDRDGVVVVAAPGERVDELLAEAEQKAATGNQIRDSVRQGMLPLDAYERYGTF